MINKSIAITGASVVALLALHSAASARPGDITNSESQAYQLGYQLELPAARAELFIHSVENLQNATDDDAVDTQHIRDLDTNAAELRSTEASAYNRAILLANSMGAPTGLKTWLAQSVDLLEEPVVISPEAKKFETAQPATARILSTLDEATTLHAQSVGNDSSVMTWLKITSGKDALWARDLGMLSARIYVSLAQNDGFHHPTPTAADLVNTAPSNMPLSVLRALRDIAPPVDKIAPSDSLILDPDVIQASYLTITNAFIGDQTLPPKGK